MSKTAISNPMYKDYMIPIIEALKQLDGSATRQQVFQLVAKNLHLSEDYLSQRLKGGQFVHRNRIDWAKYYLSEAGYLDTSKTGVWELTEKALNVTMGPKTVSDM